MSFRNFYSYFSTVWWRDSVVLTAAAVWDKTSSICLVWASASSLTSAFKANYPCFSFMISFIVFSSSASRVMLDSPVLTFVSTTYRLSFDRSLTITTASCRLVIWVFISDSRLWNFCWWSFSCTFILISCSFLSLAISITVVLSTIYWTFSSCSLSYYLHSVVSFPVSSLSISVLKSARRALESSVECLSAEKMWLSMVESSFEAKSARIESFSLF